MDDEVRKYLGFLDRGPSTTMIKRIQKRMATQRNVMGEIFAIFLENEEKAVELRDLVEQFGELDTPSQKKLKKIGETEWIHHTNRIEFESLPTEKDTKKIISEWTQNTKMEMTPKQRQVIRMVKLLREPRPGKKKIQKYSIDSMWIKRNHQKMFKGEFFKVGEYRKIGAQTMNKKHTYPHHKTVKESINVLCGIIHSMVNYIRENTTQKDHKFICYVVGLASFAHFHFADIHPFEDGNGRMCRFIGQHFLESFMPVTIPMFSSRNRYFNSLIKGRGEGNILKGSSALCRFTFITAIKFYKRLIQSAMDSPHILIVAQCCEELKGRIQKIRKVERNEIIETFKVLEEGAHFFTTTSSGKFKIKKRTEIDFDEL